MLTLNLEQKLVKENKKLVTPQELLVLKEYEQHEKLVGNDALKRVGLDGNINTGTHIKHRISTTKKETERFNQERVFHISQIQNICEKYHLRFLNTDLYKGTIDSELPERITTFEIAYGIECKQINTKIMAPASAFKLQQAPKDPLFFYKINEEYFYLIHKWGNDLSIFRRLMPIFSKNRYCALAIFVISFIVSFFYTSHLFINALSIISSLFIALFITFAYYLAAVFAAVENTVGLPFVKPSVWNSETV